MLLFSSPFLWCPLCFWGCLQPSLLLVPDLVLGHFLWHFVKLGYLPPFLVWLILLPDILGEFLIFLFPLLEQ